MLTPFKLVAVASRSYLETAPPTDELEGFRAHRLLENSHRNWLQLLGSDEEAGKTARVSRFNQTALAIAAARAGRGVAIAPEALVEPDIAAGELSVVWRDPAYSTTGFHAVGLAKPSRPAKDRDRLAEWLCGEFGAVWG